MIARRALVVTALLGALAAGCNRRPQLVPAGADSGAPSDSFAIFARLASQRWDTGDNAGAAELTARVVRDGLASAGTTTWAERTRSLLDSLSIGAEIAVADRVLMVNLFPRYAAEGPSWPYFYWHEPTGIQAQSVDGGGMRLHAIATRGFGANGVPVDSSQVAVMWTKRSGAGQQPILLVWRRGKNTRWNLMQTLGPDSLGGTGSGEFSGSGRGTEFAVRTYRPTQYFDECATCPHVFHQRRFIWQREGFQRLDDHEVPSPYTTFTSFIAALISGDFERAQRYVADPALIDFAKRFEWNDVSRGRWRVAPATDESAVEMVFFRGANDAFRVAFEPRGSDWVILGFEATQRSVE